MTKVPYGAVRRKRKRARPFGRARFRSEQL